MTAELSLQFVDTNILVYAYDISAGEKHERTKGLLKELWNTRTGCLSVQVLQEFFVTITRKVTNPLGVKEVKILVGNLSFWKVYATNEMDVLGAIDLHQQFKLSFWNAMIVWRAQQLACRTLYSEDLNPGQQFDTVEIINPFE
jgi:predicted nucleic acid-binding protein